MATENISPLYPTFGDDERRLLSKILLVLIAGGGGVPPGSDQIKYYTSDPNTEGIVPGDQSKGAVAIPADGSGPWFSWKTSTLTWE